MEVGVFVILWCLGAIQVLRNAIFLQIGPPPTPRNANNIEHYITPS